MHVNPAVDSELLLCLMNFNQFNEQKLFLQTGLMNVLYGVELSDKLVDNFATFRTSAHEQVDRCFGKLTNWVQTAGGMH